jgi:hypothetical protein
MARHNFSDEGRIIMVPLPEFFVNVHKALVCAVPKTFDEAHIPICMASSMPTKTY